MPAIPDTSMNLTNDIAQFFAKLPNISDLNARKALLYQATLDRELEGRIDVTGATIPFCHALTRVLAEYGKLTDGRDALDAVLLAAQTGIGKEGKAECERLRQRWRDAQSAPLPPLKPKSRRIALFGLLAFMLFVLAGGAFLLKDRLTNHDNPKDNRANIFGTVQNEDGLFLEKARARIGFVQTVTNENGEFELALPPNQQKDEYTLIVEKAGYRVWERTIFPDGKPLSIILQGE